MRNTKLLKTVTCFALIAIMSVASTTVKASSITDENSQAVNNELQMLMKDFESMTNEELNQYIDNVMLSYENNRETGEVTTNGVNVPEGSLEAAWLAASMIATNMGYTCGGKLVECSIYGQPYIENSVSSGTGLFTDKILSSAEYNKYFWENISGRTSTSGSFPFKSGDLFFALHNVNVQSSATLPGTIYTTYTINFTDTFDFAFDNNYESIYKSAINNWGWLSQQLGALKKIPVRITILVK